MKITTFNEPGTGKHFTNNFVCNIPNDKYATATIASLRRFFKVRGMKLKVRGRHSDRKKLFESIGRTYHPFNANANDFRVHEFGYCEYFGIYVRKS